jgi:transcriptional regulator with XRE-family HTH domain
MTRGNYARLEHGKTNFTLDSLLRIADGLDLELTVGLAKPKAKRSPGSRGDGLASRDDSSDENKPTVRARIGKQPSGPAAFRSRA